MKTTTCILSAALSVVLTDSVNVSAQTYISGGIYANTTWTFANSPYIVTGNVVVFPGFTLTIEPGVTIKFDTATSLEIRQATLVAAGTSTDNIVFTSSSPNPVIGSWGNSNGGIWINGTSLGTLFNHCLVEYSTSGINATNTIAYLKNSTIRNNNRGINYAYFPIDSCFISSNSSGIYYLAGDLLNCSLKQNYTAIESAYNVELNHCALDSNTIAIADMAGNHIINSSISYNGQGIKTQYGSRSLIENCVIDYNSIYGVLLRAANDTISNCEFYYNETGLIFGANFADGGSVALNSEMKYNTKGITIAGNFNIPCSVTECVIENNMKGIVLGNSLVTISCNRICNNTTYNLEMAMPVNYNVAGNEWCTTDSSTAAALIFDGYDNATYGLVTFLPMDTLGCSPSTEVPTLNIIKEFTVYPNPASSSFTIRQSNGMQNSELKIFNAVGEIVFRDKTGNETEHVCHPNLSQGYYTIQMYNGKQTGTSRLVIVN